MGHCCGFQKLILSQTPTHLISVVRYFLYFILHVLLQFPNSYQKLVLQHILFDTSSLGVITICYWGIFQKDQRVFTAMIWTVHFGYDNKGWPSFERAAQAIEDTGRVLGGGGSLCKFSIFCLIF